MEALAIDKSKMKSGANYVTQGLFIDYAYDDTFAQYCLAGEDKEYKGRVYPSLRRLYLEEGDLTEYEFATKHLASWDHWQRMVNNQQLRKEIDEWRAELELKLRAKAIRGILDMAMNGKYHAAKWVADKSWSTKRGRPSKEEVERERKQQARLDGELSADASRVIDFLDKKEKARG